jgi:glyoxylase-like metal-dependent hydrolase (beta-lactamase superfamily II)
MNAPALITATPVFVADLLADGERMPVYVHVINHPDARVLVDTGITELHPAVADLDPRLRPLSKQDFDLAAIDIVVNTHLHFDHCGGNHLFAGRPIYVQRRELDEPHTEGQLRVRALDPELVVARARARAMATPHRLRHHAGSLIRRVACTQGPAAERRRQDRPHRERRVPGGVVHALKPAALEAGSDAMTRAQLDGLGPWR